MKCLLIRDPSDQVRLTPFALSGFEILERGEKPGTQSPAHYDFVGTDGHDTLSLVMSVDSQARS